MFHFKPFAVYITLSAARLPAETIRRPKGFVPRPCDRFTFIEDEEVAGLCDAKKSRRSEKLTHATWRRNLLRQGRQSGGPLSG